MATVLQHDAGQRSERRADLPRPGPDAKLSRREQIVGAAEELLAQGGLDGLTIRAVLKRTGLARRALYECFAGKDDVMLAVFERVLASSAERFARLADAAGDPVGGIQVIVLGIVLGSLDADDAADDEADDESGVTRRSAALSREHLRLAEARPDDLAAALRPLMDLLTAQVTRGMDQGLLRRGDPALTAQLIYNLVATTTHSDLLNPATRQDPAQRRALADAIWQFCRAAILA